MIERQRNWIACGVIGSFVLSGCAAAPDHSGSSAGSERTFRFDYSVSVTDVPPGADRVVVWIPVPTDDDHQSVRDLVITAPEGYEVTRDPDYGNAILQVMAEDVGSDGLHVSVNAVIGRRVVESLGDAGNAKNDGPEARDLQPHRLVPTDGLIAELAAEATAGASTPLQKARAIYDYVTDSMVYDKSGDGWGRGDALRACDARTGNCTDFHSLIIGMARASGIPARFIMGFPLPSDQSAGEIGGYHCWAELYVEGTGWLPVDSSEASKHPERKERYFGGLDADRIQVSVGRDLELDGASATALNYFVYPHVEIDGIPHTKVARRFSFEDV